MGTLKNDDVESSLMKWIREVWSQHMTLTAAIFQEKACFIADALDVDDFSRLSGYFKGSRTRYGIVCQKVFRERTSVSSDAINEFLKINCVIFRRNSKCVTSTMR